MTQDVEVVVLGGGSDALSRVTSLVDYMSNEFFQKCIVPKVSLDFQAVYSFYYKGFLRHKVAVRACGYPSINTRNLRVAVQKKSRFFYRLDSSDIVEVAIILNKDKVSFFKDKESIVTYFHKKFKSKPVITIAFTGEINIFFKKPKEWFDVIDIKGATAIIKKELYRLFADVLSDFDLEGNDIYIALNGTGVDHQGPSFGTSYDDEKYRTRILHHNENRKFTAIVPKWFVRRCKL